MLQTNYGQLQENYHLLEARLTSLRQDYSGLQTNYGQFQEDYDLLEAELGSLTQSYYQLEFCYDDLELRYMSLEKVKQFVVDETIQITFSMEEEIMGLRWIKARVTNIGDSAIKKLYIVVFRYNPDGSLDKMDFPPTVIDDLGVNEVSYFSFPSAGEPFKIMAIGDYE